MPLWLKEFSTGGTSPEETLLSFLDSRTVFYPGSGTDGHPVELFASAHCAHCFIYADYGMDRTEIERQLAHPTRAFRGYTTLERISLREQDLVPFGWRPSVTPDECQMKSGAFQGPRTCGWGFLEVLERCSDLDEEHGPVRLAILFLGADGIATYDALFCQRKSTFPPFAVLLQDHGSGGNYMSFGAGGLLERLIQQAAVFPRWLLVAQNTRAWDGYESVQGLEGHRGGMHNTQRFLYQRKKLKSGN